jgi:hypothetical protein
MKYKLFVALLLVFANLFVTKAQNSKFDYLKIGKNSVKSTHQARYEIKIDKSFKPLGEFHHQPIYDKKQFNVSMTAFSDGENLILTHAETHTDGTGGLDYSDLSPVSLNGLNFTSREQCAGAEAEAAMNDNPQIKFIRSKGFNLSLPFYLKQFFVTSEDGKAEFVISYGKRIKSCDNISEDFKLQIEQEIKNKITVKKYK